ncbi:hypothetical protein MSM1_19365 [Mycobacterium sp. SM1]|uniref:hypothetical protein n=1 Tax=Mycobacterium sp. SM1 TaxID=2816243 RepID=UPI001BD1B2C5|nr:hypothetical protein [Mycobacterium sp. SM1]MBS4730390.1 hypothetical protein [Mycobacterium sp. SM1]
MLIIALVLALIGLAALVFAVVTSNELVAWVCIVASALGVVLLIIDALQERRGRDSRGNAGRPVDATSPVGQDTAHASGAGASATDTAIDADTVDTGTDETPARKPGAVADE